MECPVFINDKSTEFECGEFEAKRSALNFVKCITKISSIRNDVKILYFGELCSLSLSSYSLASLLNTTGSKDHWNRIRLAFVNADVLYADIVRHAEQDQYVSIDEASSREALLTWVNDSVMLSFNLNEAHSQQKLIAKHFKLISDTTTDIEIDNIAISEHADFYSSKLKSYGLLAASSTTVHSNDSYVIQMYINDHNPPHVHVYSSGDKSQILARVNIKNFDLLDGCENVQTVRKHLINWIRNNQKCLLENWELCKSGHYPRKIK